MQESRLLEPLLLGSVMRASGLCYYPTVVVVVAVAVAVVMVQGFAAVAVVALLDEAEILRMLPSGSGRRWP